MNDEFYIELNKKLDKFSDKLDTVTVDVAKISTLMESTSKRISDLEVNANEVRREAFEIQTHITKVNNVFGVIKWLGPAGVISVFGVLYYLFQLKL